MYGNTFVVQGTKAGKVLKISCNSLYQAQKHKARLLTREGYPFVDIYLINDYYKLGDYRIEGKH